MWRQRGREALKAIRDESVRVEAERIARSYGVRLADDDSTFAAKVRMVIWGKAKDVVDEREEERASDFCHPHGGLARPKRALRMSTEQSNELIGERYHCRGEWEDSDILASGECWLAPGVRQRRADGAVKVGARLWASESAAFHGAAVRRKPLNLFFCQRVVVSRIVSTVSPLLLRAHASASRVKEDDTDDKKRTNKQSINQSINQTNKTTTILQIFSGVAG